MIHPLAVIHQVLITSDQAGFLSGQGRLFSPFCTKPWMKTHQEITQQESRCQAFGLMRQKMVFLISQEVMAAYVLLFGQTTSPKRMGTNLLTYFMWSNPNPEKTKLLWTPLLFEAELWSFMWFTFSKSTALLLAMGIDTLSKWFLGSQLILLLECEENLISPISLSHLG